METPISIPRKFDLALFASLVTPWILLGYLPWAVWLDGWPWLRLALAGLVFVVPGMTLSLLLMGNRLTLLSHVTSGVALSVFIVGSLGMIARVAHLPFDFIKPAFFAVGLIALLVLSIQPLPVRQLCKPGNFSIGPISILLFMISLGVAIAFTQRLAGDDFSYLARLTNWQHSPRLDFGEVIFGKGDLEFPRFWLAMFPMSQAFLAELSKLHGVLLLGYYLGPVLMVLGLLAAYSLYEDLLQSDRLGALALLIQFAFFCLLLDVRQPGNLFFLRATEDKAFAAFLLAPVFLLAVRCFLESQTWRRGLFVLLCGWSLALVHPIILAYGVFIAGGYAAIVTLSRKDYKTLGLALALLGLVLLPGASLRYVPLPGTSTKYAFDLEDALSTYNAEDLISYVNGTPFYGFNLDKLRTPIGEGTSSPWSVVLSWSYLWILGLSFLWSLYELRRRGPVAPLIVASALLVLLCAVPYTGWLVGYVVTARMLWRSFLLFPIGLAAVSLVWPIFNAVSSRLSAGPRREIFAQRATMFTILPICILLIIYSSIQQLQLGWQNLSGMKEYQGNLEYMAALGDDLESNIQEPATFLASVGLMRYLPGLSSKAKVVYFRAPQFTPYSVHREELARVRSSDHQISIEERMEVLRRYNIRYLLTQNAGLARLLAEFPQFFRKQRLGGYWLIEFEELTP